MGLDIVELVMRCEETFAVTLLDEKLERVQTVGDLYIYLCEALAVTPLDRPARPTAPLRLSLVRPSPAPKEWTPETVWATLVYVVTDQLKVDEAEVSRDANFSRDLGAD
jgi:acyl carrier protein